MMDRSIIGGANLVLAWLQYLILDHPRGRAHFVAWAQREQPEAYHKFAAACIGQGSAPEHGAIALNATLCLQHVVLETLKAQLECQQAAEAARQILDDGGLFGDAEEKPGEAA